MNGLLWVPIPGGIAETGEAVIRVLVVPKLQPSTSIEDYGLGDWPGVLRGDFGETEVVLSTRAAGYDTVDWPLTLVPRADSAVWNEFFGGDAGSVDPAWPVSPADVHVRDTHGDARRVVDTYRSVAERLASPDADQSAVVTEAIAGHWQDAPVPDPGTEPVDSQNRRIDFHRAVSLLREHPTVALRLGLVLETRADPSCFFGADTDAYRYALSVRPSSPQLLAALVTPVWTRFEWRQGADDVPTVFRPAAADPTSGLTRGLVDLSSAKAILPAAPAAPVAAPPPWAIATFDVNGAASAMRTAQAGQGTSPSVMPPIRSAGITLLRPGLAVDAATTQQRAGARDADKLEEGEFGAEDLLLGYRVDIRQNGQPWRSLCSRHATFRVNGRLIGDAVTEEGHVKPFAATRTKGTASTDRLVTDQSVVRWDGWSLGVPRIDLTGATREPPGSTSLPYRFDWDFDVVEGSLPRLRFARLYQLRLRCVDLAGGGPDVQEANGLESSHDWASPAVSYYRYDPIQPPLSVAGSDELSTGASVDTLVIRSDRGLTPEQLAATTSYRPTDTRELRPPTVSPVLVEQHGMFDRLSAAESWELVGRPEVVDPAMGGLIAYVVHPSGPASAPLEEVTAWPDADRPQEAWPNQLAKRITLRGTSAATPITMLWSDDTSELVIRVAKGVSRTVELSSTVREDFQDHLAIAEWLLDKSATLPNIVNGRNPAVTPARQILVVHAVRRPLIDPRWQLPPEAVERAPRQTLVVLHPEFAPSGGPLGLDTESTGQLDVVARWQDVNDDGPEAGRQVTDRSLDHFFSTPIDQGPPPQLALTHEFGDTKVRSVTYTLNAITRYRAYFDIDESDDLFHAALDQPAVLIGSSARPEPPQVLGTYPAFAWGATAPTGDRIEHRRTARTIRVELARPWFGTGDGELLGVVVAAPGATTPAEWTTRIGRDPVFGTPPPASSYPDETWFTNAAGPAEDVAVPELDHAVRVLPFAVDAAGDRWYADIAMTLPGADSYNPLVGLAVVRYQAQTIPGVPKVSTPVLTDRVPLLPHRTVAVTRSGGHLTVTVTGTGPIEPANVVTAVLERAHGPTDLIATGEADGSGIAAWTPSQPSVSAPLGTPLAALVLPTDATRLRVRISEHEDLSGGSASGPAELGRRNVTLDTIDLPAGWLS